MDVSLSATLFDFALLFITISGISLLFKRFRLPIVLAPVLFGIFARYTPLAEHLEADNFRIALETLSNFGILFLLFYIGLQIDFKSLKQFGRPILKLTGLSIVLPFVFGFSLIWGLGYGLMLALIIGMTRIPVAEAVVVPILDEFGLLNTKIGQFIIGPGVLDDMVEVALVALVSIWLSSQVDLAEHISPLEIVFGMAVFVATAFVGYRWLVPLLGKRVDHSLRITMVFCVAILFFYAGLSEYAKLGLVIGALTAGMVVRPWLNSLEDDNGDKIIHAVQLFAYGFVGIFFFYQVGLMVDPAGILANPVSVIGLFLASAFGKLFSSLWLAKDKVLTLRESLIVGLGLNVQMTTELIIAQMLLTAGAINTELYTALIAASSLSMITVPSLLAIYLRKWHQDLKPA